MSELDRQSKKPAVEVVFEQALSLGGGDRVAYLTKVCGEDRDLRARVEALLRANGDESGFLPGEDSVETLRDDSPVLEEEGRAIGRYKLLEKLGEGGFGSVWAAEQREPVKRRVALKIVKLGMDTKQVVARFEAERQALALMDHPNIAKVLDAGTTDTGRPYFVMELVKGIPITKYFEKEGSPVEEKLKLFIRVCQAIQHAHQKGIIHRDIKPSNVMLTLHDGEPVPKVIDFGIAKATQGELTDKTIYTQYSQFIGTPAYMSPEQAEMSGLDIDTRSDVYSLGVLLYEVLTGGTPFDSKELMASGIDEMRKIICERDPIKPSTRVSQSLSSDSSSSSGVHFESISSDLDWIVMKCLEKDRSRRYETSNGLAMDLQRYMADEPILARPPSLGYRLQKAYRRNQFLVIGAAAAALFLVIGLVAASYSWNREKVARMEAEEAKGEAETNQQIAVQAKEEADQFAADARRSLYVADMNLASLALARNNLGKARGILAPYREDPKFADKLGWEWRYLWQEVNATEETDWSKHHENAITAVSFLGDSSRVVSGGHDGTVKIWDRNTDEVETLFQLEFASIRTLTVTPNGREVGIVWEDRAKAASVRNAMGVFDTVSGSELARYNSHGSGNQHRTIRFLGDGSHLLMNQDQRAWYLVDRETGSKELLLEASRGPAAVSEGEEFVVVGQGRRRTIQIIHLDPSRQKIEVNTGERFDALAASSASGLVASGHFLNPAIKLFDSRSGDLVRELSGHSAWVSSLAFSPDGRWLYSGSADQTIRIWDVGSGELLKTYRGHTDEVWSLDLSPDGVTLVSGGKDGSVRLWPAVPSFGQDPINRFINDIEFPVLARAPGGDAAIICGVDRSDPTLVRFFELGAGKVLNKRVFRSQDEPVKQVALAWDSRLWMLVDSDQKDSSKLIEVDLATEEVRHETVIQSEPDNRVGFVTNPFQLSLIRTHLVVDQERVYPLARWNGGAPDFLSWPPYGEGARFSVASPNASEQRLVFQTAGGTIVSLDGETGGIRSTRAHGQFVSGISFSPDGRLIYSGGLDGFARCWDVASMELVGRPMRSQLMAIHSLGLSPDGRRLVTGSVDGRVTIWEAASQRELGMIDFSDQMRRVRLLSFLTNDILLVGGQRFQSSRDQGNLWQVCRAPREVADR